MSPGFTGANGREAVPYPGTCHAARGTSPRATPYQRQKRCSAGPCLPRRSPPSVLADEGGCPALFGRILHLRGGWHVHPVRVGMGSGRMLTQRHGVSMPPGASRGARRKSLKPHASRLKPAVHYLRLRPRSTPRPPRPRRAIVAGSGVASSLTSSNSTSVSSHLAGFGRQSSRICRGSPR